jgi:glutamate dehydrogenase
MGITARGAWVMIDRHFREVLGRSVQDAPFTWWAWATCRATCSATGCWSRSKTRLLAAFDHRHIFLDPDPDPAASFAERERLFRLPRSSWADYEARLISPGGGVFPRNAKTLPLSPRRARCSASRRSARSPPRSCAPILRWPVDLLYFGGIGTYVKARTREPGRGRRPRQRRDPRRRAGHPRAQVSAKGANLGVTQAGRIEAGAPACASTPTRSTIPPASAPPTTR